MPRKRKHGKQIKQVTVSTRITGPMLKRLNEYLATGVHVSLADYVRDLIRRDLEAKGLEGDILDKKPGGKVKGER